MSSEETVATSTSQHGCTSVGSGVPCNVSTHIYSLLSLVEHGGLKACYTKTRDQLYREATKHIIDLENTLDILSSCCDPLHLREPEWATYYEQMLSSRTALSSNYDAAVSRTGSKFNLPQKEGDMLTVLLPSWIPAFHFSNKTTDRHSLGISLRSTCYYHASGNSAPHVGFVPGREECMQAHGILVDTSHDRSRASAKGVQRPPLPQRMELLARAFDFTEQVQRRLRPPPRIQVHRGNWAGTATAGSRPLVQPIK